MVEKIDFIMPWVDGSDPEWQKIREKFRPEDREGGSSSRFRSWDNLQYWFRGVEKYAPWVSHIFFVTNGQKPEWLNISHPKIRFVRHTDFIPEQYLPTFNTNTIELNFHRIPDLAEHFVLFNDDIFICRALRPEDFFLNGLPAEMLMEYPIGIGTDPITPHLFVNNNCLNAKYFNRKEVIRQQKAKIINPHYGKVMWYNLLLSLIPYPNLIGLLSVHVGTPYRRSAFEQMWKREPELLDETCRHRFRSKSDVTEYAIRMYELLSGNFEPYNRMKIGKMYQLGKEDETLLKAIRNQDYPMICIADNVDDGEFESMKGRVNSALESILPEKCAYEM